MDWEKIHFIQECIDICINNSYEPESKKCINCLYCRECLYEYENGYECLYKHFWFYPDEDGIPEKPCLKNDEENAIFNTLEVLTDRKSML